METIQIGYCKLKNGSYHKYLVYTDSNGEKWGARMGPDGETDIDSYWGDLKATFGPYEKRIEDEEGNIVQEGFVDYDDEGNDPLETIAQEEDLSGAWAKIKETMLNIEDGEYPYRPFTQNCNTAVDMALKVAGLPDPVKDDFKNYLSFGSVDGIPEQLWSTFNMYFIDSTLLERVERRDPLILDLDGDGIETISINSGAYFDHDGNGFAEQTGWAAPDDGLLVRDINGNGTIDSGKELFGDQAVLKNGSNATNGFQALADLDDNNDGKIDANDAAYSQLKVWCLIPPK